MVCQKKLSRDKKLNAVYNKWCGEKNAYAEKFWMILEVRISESIIIIENLRFNHE